MRNLWDLIEKYHLGEYANTIFLTVNIIRWTVLTFLTGMLFCVIGGQIAIGSCLLNVMLIAVYAGIIFGLFGGIIFLMRNENGKLN